MVYFIVEGSDILFVEDEGCIVVGEMVYGGVSVVDDFLGRLCYVGFYVVVGVVFIVCCWLVRVVQMGFVSIFSDCLIRMVCLVMGWFVCLCWLIFSEFCIISRQCLQCCVMQCCKVLLILLLLFSFLVRISVFLVVSLVLEVSWGVVGWVVFLMSSMWFLNYGFGSRKVFSGCCMMVFLVVSECLMLLMMLLYEWVRCFSFCGSDVLGRWCFLGEFFSRNMYIWFFDIGVRLILQGLLRKKWCWLILGGCGNWVCQVFWFVYCGVGVWGKSRFCMCENSLLVLMIRLQWLCVLLVSLVLIWLCICLIFLIDRFSFIFMLVFVIFVERILCSIGCMMLLQFGMLFFGCIGVGSMVRCVLLVEQIWMLWLVQVWVLIFGSMFSVLNVCSVGLVMVMLVLQMCYCGFRLMSFIVCFDLVSEMVVDMLLILLFMIRIFFCCICMNFYGWVGMQYVLLCEFECC